MKAYKKQFHREGRREGCRKALLYVCLALVTLTDLLAVVFLGVSGVTSAKFVACPVLLLIADALFLLFALFTNFRFRYSIGGTALYCTAAVALTVTAAATQAGGGVMTTAATALFAAVHFVGIAGAAVSAFDAAKLGKTLRRAAFTLCALIGISLIGYGVFLVTGGFFGQGNAGRIVEYRYSAMDDGYVAVSLVAGRGKKLTVPETFNGKRVSAVNCEILTARGLKEIYLESAGSLTLQNPEKLSAFQSGVVVYADRTEYDALRGNYFEEAYEKNSESLLRFACSFAPTGLDKNEVFVSFNYSMETLKTAKGEVLPVWIGEKGSAFQTGFSEVGYALHADETNEEDLVWNHFNTNDYIFASPAANGVMLNGKQINKSVAGAEVYFNRIYRVSVNEDNDEVYETPNEYKVTDSENGDLPYRLTTLATCDDLLDQIPQRAGFSLGFKTGEGLLSGTFSDVLRASKSGEVNITPVWSLNAPVFAPTSDETVMYGEKAEVSWSATAPAENINVAYRLDKPNADVPAPDDNKLAFAKFEPRHAGVYTVKATASAPAVTSLTSEAVLTFTLTLQKRPLELQWDEIDPVYSASEKTIGCSPVREQVLEGDEITLSLSRNAVRDAGSYTVSAVLTDDAATKYKINNHSHEYVVTPRSVEVVWAAESSYVYNGKEQAPAATFTPLPQDGAERTLTVSGARNAGTHSARAVNSDPNYTLTGGTREFTIRKKSVALVWKESAFTYNGNNQHPTVASVENEVSGEESGILSKLSYASDSVDAGSHTVTASLSHPNYSIGSGNTKDFTIAKRDYSVRFVSDGKMYDGKAYSAFSSTVSDLAARDTAEAVAKITYRCDTDLTSAGTHNVTLNVETLSANYNAPTVQPGTVTISKRSLTLSVDNKEKTYDGQAFTAFTYTAEGLADGETIKNACSQVYYWYTDVTNAGRHTITLRVSGASDNYSITCVEGTLTILKREVALSWSYANKHFAWNEDAGKMTASVSDKVFTAEITYEYRDSSGNLLDGAPTTEGKYTVTAVCSDENYTLTDTVCEFWIDPKPEPPKEEETA